MFGHVFNVINDMFFSKTDEKNKKIMKKAKDEKTNSHKLEETVVKRNVFNNGGGSDLVVNAFCASTMLNSTNDNGSKSSHYLHSENYSNDGGGDSGGGDSGGGAGD